MGKIVKPDKEAIKKDFSDYKKDFTVAVKDKKRWLACLIELAITGVLLAADLLIKHFVYGYCAENGDIIIIDGVIRFTAVRNTGASFGIFKNATTALAVVSLICAVILVFFIFYSYPRRNKWLRAALVMITAGAFGNVIDRFALGYVRDMVYFELIDFAVFNFADSCLTVGTAVLVIYLLFFYMKDEEKSRKVKEEKAEADRIKKLIDEAESDEASGNGVNAEKNAVVEPENENETSRNGDESGAEEEK